MTVHQQVFESHDRENQKGNLSIFRLLELTNDNFFILLSGWVKFFVIYFFCLFKVASAS